MSPAKLDGERSANYPERLIQRHYSKLSDVRDPNFGTILGGAAIGTAASAIIQGVTGDKTITGHTTILGSVLGSAVAANQNRNLGKTIRDAAIGAALGVRCRWTYG